MDPTIHVHTSSDKATVAYVKFMWETMLKLADHPDKIQLHIHCIGPRAVDELNNLPQSEAHQVHKAREGGSFGHAACIMDALSMMTDECAHVICDSDAFVVAKGWDNLVRQRVEQGIGILGTTYEDLGGFSSGGGNVQTYKKIPTFTWAIVGPGYDWNKLEVMPNKDHRIHIKNEALSEIYGLPVGHYVFGEAGYQLPEFVHDRKIRYEGWRQLKPSRDAVVLHGLNDYHEEYHVDNVPFVVHHRGSLRHPYRGSKMSNAFFEKVDKWIENEQRGEPRWSGKIANVSWSQLQLPFMYTEPAPRRNFPQPDGFDGWLKVTIDSNVVRPKNKLTETLVNLTFPTKENYIQHMRIEGSANHKLLINIPDVMNQSLTVRNMTNVTISVQRDARSAMATIEPGSSSLIITDVDGVIKIN